MGVYKLSIGGIMELLQVSKVTDEKKLNKNLLILYLLNLSDLFFTKFLLSSAPDLFREVNPFLNPMIDGLMPYIVKIGIMALVLFYWNVRSKRSTPKQLKRSIIISKVLLVLYCGINLLHLVNLGVFIFFKNY